MGNNYKIVPTQRTTWHRFSKWVIDQLDELKKNFVTEQGVSLEVECPHCKANVEILDLMIFGKIYEFSCQDCKNIFTVAIPNLVIRKGTIEGTIDVKLTKSNPKPLHPAAIHQSRN